MLVTKLKVLVIIMLVVVLLKRGGCCVDGDGSDVDSGDDEGCGGGGCGAGGGNSGRPVTVEDRVTSAPDGHKSRPPMLADVLTQALRKAALGHCCSRCLPSPYLPHSSPLPCRRLVTSAIIAEYIYGHFLAVESGWEARRGRVWRCGRGLSGNSHDRRDEGPG